MEEYTAKDVIKTLKEVIPANRTRKRLYIDKRNYLICILYYKFSYTEKMIENIFSLTKNIIDRTTVNYAKQQPTYMVKCNDPQFLENISLLYKQFPFKIPETNFIKFVDKTITFTISSEQLCMIKDFAEKNNLNKSQAAKKLIEVALNTIDTSSKEILWEK